ncbi:hypothetical protein BC938DRAFT_480264 [Jimgerdemannia flammicorona]|uniref:Uncharacterized protein n=1 Tax=Jimgerdemannia flammicorona TaxID=994334 RepID=A0A433QXL8_9FUNG|nr:hypothetical protein BC938DRAFT_480264 [Jimgerdemannia flammicorona]
MKRYSLYAVEGSTLRNTSPALTKHIKWRTYLQKSFALQVLLKCRGVNEDYMSTSAPLTAAGIIDVQTTAHVWGIGWGPERDIAEPFARIWVELVCGTRPQICAALGIGDSEYDQTVDDIRQELSYDNPDNRAIVHVFSHVGRKPMA